MVVVVNYGMGNLHSVSKALEAVGGDVLVTNKAKDIEKAERIVLPGVGSFVKGIEQLIDLGLKTVLYEEVVAKKKPFLGICLGMQLVASRGEEYGEKEGLDWIRGKVAKFSFENNKLKIPHMGWDDVEFKRDCALFKDIKSPATFYFVHSYHFIPEDSRVISGLCNYGIQFAAAVSSKNIHLVQFHPEKSHRDGLQMLKNFLSIA